MNNKKWIFHVSEISIFFINDLIVIFNYFGIYQATSPPQLLPAPAVHP